MSRIDRIALKLYLFGLPAVIAIGVAAWALGLGANAETGRSALLALCNNAWGLVVATWLLLSLYLGARLMTSRGFRNATVARIAGIRERDEREEQMSGRAIRASFLATIALLICLFFLSTLKVSIYHVPESRAADGKTGMLSVSLGVWDKSPAVPPYIGEENVDMSRPHFFYDGLPLAMPVLIIVLILWQVLSYRYAMRRICPRHK